MERHLHKNDINYVYEVVEGSGGRFPATFYVKRSGVDPVEGLEGHAPQKDKISLENHCLL